MTKGDCSKFTCSTSSARPAAAQEHGGEGVWRCVECVEVGERGGGERGGEGVRSEGKGLKGEHNVLFENSYVLTNQSNASFKTCTV